jgi:PPK2 family polyphosphate:nucleotide phosphotransferase
MIDSTYCVKPGATFNLDDVSSSDTGDFSDKKDALAAIEKNLEHLRELQAVFYASGRKALLVVLQAMDAGGKDGVVSHVFSGVNPQGCIVHSFKVPTELESRHDYLWRIHAAAPPRGMIGIFNRSHYESLLVERVEDLTPKSVWSERFDSINAFEKMLTDEGTVILKFHLNISRDEQKKRLKARLDQPDSRWKFSAGDVKERRKWNDYRAAYNDLLSRCSTTHAPWFVVPSDHKWFRNWVVSDTIVRTMKKLDLKYPKPKEDLSKIKVD